MTSLRFLALIFAVTLPLSAQQLPLNEHELGAYKGKDDAVRSLTDYCNALDDSAGAQQPLIFAEVAKDSGSGEKNSHWDEFSNRDNWVAAGKPAPVAFVWNRDGLIVRVSIVTGIPRSQVSHLSRVDYCYGADSNLVRIRAVPFSPQECEFLFPCRLISGHEFLLGGQRPAVTDWIFTPDGGITKLRNGKTVDDYFDPANSLTADDLDLKTSDQLPFNRPAPPQ